MTQHLIERIEPRTGYRLLVHWTTGEKSLVDFSKDIANGPVWLPLRDEQKFGQVRVTYSGMVIEWPEPARHNGEPEIEVDADGLWHMAQTQNIVVAAE